MMHNFEHRCPKCSGTIGLIYASFSPRPLGCEACLLPEVRQRREEERRERHRVADAIVRDSIQKLINKYKGSNENIQNG